MPFKKGKKKKNIELNRIKFLNIKKVDLKKFKVNPTNIIENTKIANNISSQIISLPIGETLSTDQIKYVCEKINKFLNIKN